MVNLIIGMDSMQIVWRCVEKNTNFSGRFYGKIIFENCLEIV